MSEPKSPEEKTAAEIATGPEPKPEPKPVVKDDKWLDEEICRTEDKLRTLREQKQTNTPQKTQTPAKKKSGWECEDLV